MRVCVMKLNIEFSRRLSVVRKRMHSDQARPNQQTNLTLIHIYGCQMYIISIHLFPMSKKDEEEEEKKQNKTYFIPF